MPLENALKLHHCPLPSCSSQQSLSTLGSPSSPPSSFGSPSTPPSSLGSPSTPPSFLGSPSTPPSSLGSPSTPNEVFSLNTHKATSSVLSRSFVWDQYKSACVNEEEAFDELAVIKTQKQQVDEDKISSIERVYVRRYLQKMKHREETAVILCSMYRDELIKVREKVREQKLQLDIVKTTF